MSQTETITQNHILNDTTLADNLGINWALVCPAEPLEDTPSVQIREETFDRLLQICLGAIHHEVRTPLALIFQLIEMLEDPAHGELSEQQLDALTALRRQAQMLGQMIDGLMYISTYVEKKQKLRPVQARLNPIIVSVLALADFKARSKQIVIETDIAPNLPPLLIDVKQIEEALNQLLDNAIKFNHIGGKAKFTAQADSDWVILTVSDTGTGIEDRLLDKVWNVFEQAADPLRRAQEGLGVGLSVARHIIEAHQGEINVATRLGQGSIFTVKLPRSK